MRFSRFLVHIVFILIIATPVFAARKIVPESELENFIYLTSESTLVCDTQTGLLGNLKTDSSDRNIFKTINKKRKIRKLRARLKALRESMVDFDSSHPAFARIRDRVSEARNAKKAFVTEARLCRRIKNDPSLIPATPTPTPNPVQNIQPTPTPLPTNTPTPIPTATPTPNSFINPEVVKPKLKAVENLNEFPIEFNSEWVMLTTGEEEDSFAADYINSQLAKVTDSQLALTTGILENSSQTKAIIIGNPEESEELAAIAAEYEIDLDSMIQHDFNQGYVLVMKPEHILLLAKSAAGRFYAAVTLSWLFQSGDANPMYLPNVIIRDWPDTNIRGFYGGGTFYIPELDREINTSTERELWIDYLTKLKFNALMGGIPALSAYYDAETETFTQPEDNYSQVISAKYFQNYLLQRHFFNIVTINPRSVLKFNPNLREGVFVDKAPFKWNEDDQAESLLVEPVLQNADFDMVVDTETDYWYTKHQNGADDNWAYEPTSGIDGGPAMHLTSHLGTCGVSGSSAYLLSDVYDLDSEQVYQISFKAKVESDEVCQSYHPQVTVVVLDENDEVITTHSANPYYPNEGDGYEGWQDYRVNFTTYNGEKKFYIYSRASWTSPLDMYLDKFEFIRVSDKLKNVIKTDATEITLYPSADSNSPYQKDVDYELVDIGDFDFNYPMQGKTTVVKRLDSGSIPRNTTVYLSYDFIVNMQQLRDESNSLVEPKFFQYFDQYQLKSTMEKLQPDYVFVGEDERRGMNRDSRSKRLNMSNGKILGLYLNIINSQITSYKADTKVFIWDDMISPFHNGGYDDYQTRYGGIPGASWHAIHTLSRNYLPIAWRYGVNDTTHKVSNSPVFYGQLGFDMFTGPCTYEVNLGNVIQSSEQVERFGLSGIINHEFYNDIGGLKNSAEYAWNHHDPVADLSDDNLEVCNGIDDDGNNLYWEKSYLESEWPYSSTGIDEGFDLQNDAFNCGACSNTCYYMNGEGQCVEGECQLKECLPGYSNSDGDLSNGCESIG